MTWFTERFALFSIELQLTALFGLCLCLVLTLDERTAQNANICIEL